MTIITYAAVALVAVLFVIAIYYNVLLYRKNIAADKAQLELETQLEKRKKDNKKSIEIIARALLEKQVTLTEASIRINALSQSLELDPKTLEHLSVFRQLSEATAHIPILDRWKRLTKKEKKAFDIERQEIESGFCDFVVVAASKIAKERILG